MESYSFFMEERSDMEKGREEDPVVRERDNGMAETQLKVG